MVSYDEIDKFAKEQCEPMGGILMQKMFSRDCSARMQERCAVVNYGRVILDKIKHRISVDVPNAASLDMNIETLQDYVTDELMYHLEFFLAGKTHTEKEGVEYVPATWWDAVKERFLSKYKLKWKWAQVCKRGIATKVIVTKICPHLPTRDSRDWDRHIEFVQRHGLGELEAKW